MQSENVYIGDDKFQRFLDHYNCPAPLGVVKLRFAGAVCSPNPNLRPTDVIASLFAENMQPRLTTKNEAELFFKFFMGLWDEMFVEIKTNILFPVSLSGLFRNFPETKTTRKNWQNYAIAVPTRLSSALSKAFGAAARHCPFLTMPQN